VGGGARRGRVHAVPARGIFNAATGAAFVEHILSKGNSEDPAELFRRFMGREPDLSALLERSGLTG